VLSDSIINGLANKFSARRNSASEPSPSDPSSKGYADFNSHDKRTDSDRTSDTHFTYKKNKFVRRTPDDIKDLFDVDKMLPQEIEDDWFDVEPLQSTKKIKGCHLIHPKFHMGVNTVGSSLRNATHDPRGDIPNPKINISPFNNSTIEPDTNIRGFCN
jgi:hypothetical protein